MLDNQRNNDDDAQLLVEILSQGNYKLDPDQVFTHLLSPDEINGALFQASIALTIDGSPRMATDLLTHACNRHERQVTRRELLIPLTIVAGHIVGNLLRGNNIEAFTLLNHTREFLRNLGLATEFQTLAILSDATATVATNLDSANSARIHPHAAAIQLSDILIASYHKLTRGQDSLSKTISENVLCRIDSAISDYTSEGLPFHSSLGWVQVAGYLYKNYPYTNSVAIYRESRRHFLSSQTAHTPNSAATIDRNAIDVLYAKYRSAIEETFGTIQYVLDNNQPPDDNDFIRIIGRALLTQAEGELERDPEKALDMLNGARSVFEALGDSAHLAPTWAYTGAAYSASNDPGRAFAAYSTARTHYAALTQQDLNIAVCHHNMGRARATNNENLPEAISFYCRALKTYEQLTELERARSIAADLGAAEESLGNLLLSEENLEDALNSFQRAKAWLEKIDDQNGIARINWRIGGAKFDTSEFGDSAESFLLARNLYEATGRKEDQALCAENAALSFLALDQIGEAIALFSEAYKIQATLNNSHRLDSITRNLQFCEVKIANQSIEAGARAEGEGKIGLADDLFSQAVEHLSRADHKLAAASVLVRLGNLRWRALIPDTADEAFAAAETLFSKAGEAESARICVSYRETMRTPGPELATEARDKIAFAWLQAGERRMQKHEYRAAFNSYQAAEQIYASSKDRDIQCGVAKTVLGLASVALGDLDDGWTQLKSGIIPLIRRKQLPAIGVAYIRHGLALQAQKAHGGANLAYTYAIGYFELNRILNEELAPNDALDARVSLAQAHILKGRILRNYGAYDPATQQISLAVEILDSTQHREPWLQAVADLALAHYSARDYKRAIEVSQLVQPRRDEKTSILGQIYNLRAVCLALVGDRRQATEEFHRSIETFRSAAKAEYEAITLENMKRLSAGSTDLTLIVLDRYGSDYPPQNPDNVIPAISEDLFVGDLNQLRERVTQGDPVAIQQIIDMLSVFVEAEPKSSKWGPLGIAYLLRAEHANHPESRILAFESLMRARDICDPSEFAQKGYLAILLELFLETKHSIDQLELLLQVATAQGANVPNSQLARWHRNLSRAYHSRAAHLRPEDDYEVAIKLEEEYITDDQQPGWITVLSSVDETLNLAEMHLDRFRYTHALDDALASTALALAPLAGLRTTERDSGDLHREVDRASELACRSLRLVHEKLGEDVYLDAAIDLGREVASLFDNKSVSATPRLCTEIGIALRHRCLLTGLRSDAESATYFSQLGVDSREDPSDYALSALASSLLSLHRFSESHDDLRRALRYAELALSSAASDSDVVSYQCGLANVLLTCHVAGLDDLSNSFLNNAISLLTPVVAREHLPHAQRYVHLNSLSHCLYTRHNVDPGSGEDIATALDLSTAAVNSTPIKSPYRTHVIKNFTNICTAHADLFKDIRVLGDAIKLVSQSLDRETLDTTQAETASAIATLLRTRFRSTYGGHDLRDIDMAIDLLQFAILASSRNLSGEVEFTWSLSQCLDIRYDNSRDREDFDSLLRLLHTGLTDSNASASQRVRFAESLLDRLDLIRAGVSATGLSSSELATAADDATHVIAHCHPHDGGLGYKWTVARRALAAYQNHRDSNQLEEAIENLSSLAEHPRFAKDNYVTEYLATAYKMRFQETGSLHDLDKCIKHGRQFSSTRGSTLWVAQCGDMGDYLRMRYEAIGAVADLDEAIELMCTAGDISSVQPGFEYRSLHNNLGIAYRVRAADYGDRTDNDSALIHSYLTVALEPLGDNESSRHNNNLALSYHHRYERNGDLGDLESAIIHARLAITGTRTAGEVASLAYEQLTNLALLLTSRAREYSDPIDLEEAIICLDRARAVAPLSYGHGHVHEAIVGGVRRAQYDLLEEPVFLDRSIDALSTAVALSSELPVAQSRHRAKLGDALILRGAIADSEEDIRLGLDHNHAVASSPLALPQDRVDCAHRCAVVSRLRGDLARALDSYRVAVDLMPRTVVHGLSRADGERILSQWAGLASEAAATALALNDPTLAVDLLERGRGVLWAQLLSTRTDVDVLADSHPDIAGKVFAALASIAGSHVPTPDQVRRSSPRASASRNLDQLIDQVRDLEGFEHFMGSPPVYQMAQALSSWCPAVIVNVSTFRTDALILQNGIVHNVPLHSVTGSAVEGRVRQYLEIQSLLSDADSDLSRRAAESAFLDLLHWLWDALAKPILDALGPADRICWIPTGPLGSLPIHAAGVDFEFGSTQNVHDRVISVYAPTVRSLYEVIENLPTEFNISDVLSPSGNEFLIVGMPSTPGQNDLPGVSDEIDFLSSTFNNDRPLIGESADRTRVLKKLGGSRWAHLSCHGMQSFRDPSTSGPILADGVLSISQVAEAKMEPGELMFLSACHGHTSGLTAADEVVTIAAAFSYMGWRNIVSTTWTVADEVAKVVAKDFYTRIRSAEFYLDPPAALHAAINDFRRSHPATPSLWAPFIALGLPRVAGKHHSTMQTIKT